MTHQTAPRYCPRRQCRGFVHHSRIRHHLGVAPSELVTLLCVVGFVATWLGLLAAWFGGVR
jgi:hypothetical protein